MEITLKIEDHIKLIQMISDLTAKVETYADRIHDLECQAVDDRQSLQCLEERMEEKNGIISSMQQRARNLQIDLEALEGWNRRLHMDRERAEAAITEMRSNLQSINHLVWSETCEGLTPYEECLVKEGKKIQAIQAVRTRTGMGLVECKRFVESRM